MTSYSPTDSPTDRRIRKDLAPLYLQARRQLLAMIEAREFPPGSQLPREQEIARTLGVSRPTVREALALLQVEGVVTRRHGAGNFVNHVPPAIAARIDELMSLPQIIAENGLTPEMANLHIETIAASETVAGVLNLAAPGRVFLVQRLYLASGQPAVWVTDFVPATAIQHAEQWRQFDGDMLRFLRDTCHSPVTYAVATIDVIDADSARASHLRIAAGTGILRITHTAYTSANVAVSHSIGYHRPGVITYSLIRKARP